MFHCIGRVRGAAGWFQTRVTKRMLRKFHSVLRFTKLLRTVLLDDYVTRLTTRVNLYQNVSVLDFNWRMVEVVVTNWSYKTCKPPVKW